MSKTWTIYLLALVSFLVGTSEYIIAGILDKIAGTLGITLGAAGQLITVFSLVYAICTPFIMAATVRWERRRLLVVALSVFAAANLLAFILPGYGLFFVARILMALAAGVVVVSAYSLAAKIAPKGKQASSIATVITGFTASLIIGVPLGRIIAASYDWKLVFGGIAILGILAVLVIRFSIPTTEGDAPIPLRKQLTMLKNPRIATALAVSFFWLGGYSIAYTYISPYLLTLTGLNEKSLSIALFAFGLASLVGSKFGGYSTDKWGVSRTLVSGMALHGVILILLTLAASQPFAVFPLLLLWSLSAWSSGPAQQFNLVTLAPESSGVLISLNSSVMQLAMAAGAGIGGIVLNHVSLNSITWIGGLGVIVAAAIAFISFRLPSSSRNTAEMREVKA